ncbi:hypothetical protein BCV70DRAFT_206243 [Testicularia cyperi]|uniref:Uncharacterized protein n=1 Tax=Testicularia cyperi TaxID=1882483 RepID=A0A317XR95_9BASI|nr:hypothetical protein BCV70DRAFT_206243 [Testicularia cyperi]
MCLEESFAIKFQGHAHQHLHNFVHEMLSNIEGTKPTHLHWMSQPYRLMMPILQCSRTGKMQLVIQLQERMPILYVCLHEAAHTTIDQGYLLVDLQVSTYFCGMLKYNGCQDIANAKVLAFVATWFNGMVCLLCNHAP